MAESSAVALRARDQSLKSTPDGISPDVTTLSADVVSKEENSNDHAASASLQDGVFATRSTSSPPLDKTNECTTESAQESLGASVAPPKIAQQVDIENAETTLHESLANEQVVELHPSKDDPEESKEHTLESQKPALTPTRKKKQTPTKKSRPRKAKADPLSKDYLLQNEKSRLVTTDLHNLFLDPQSWELLTTEEQKAVVDLMPDYALAAGTERTAIDHIYLAHSIPWRTDVRLFKEELSAGGFDPKIMAEGLDAYENRAQGKFDTWKENEFEEFWGQKQRVSGVVSGQSAKIKLEELIRANIFEVGDIWSYSRYFRLPDGATCLVEKECTIMEIKQGKGSTVSAVKISYPPGTHKLSSKHLREDLEIDAVSSLQALESAILGTDSRISDPANGNAWRVFRCIRRNQDIGGLWELRHDYWRQREPEDENESDYTPRKKAKKRDVDSNANAVPSKRIKQKSKPTTPKQDKSPNQSDKLHDSGTRRSSRNIRKG